MLEVLPGDPTWRVFLGMNSDQMEVQGNAIVGVLALFCLPDIQKA